MNNIEKILTEYNYQNVGQFRAIVKDLGYNESYNNGNLRFQKNDEVSKVSLAKIKSHIKTSPEKAQNSLQNVVMFLDRKNINDQKYRASLLKEKNISFVIHGGTDRGKDGLTIIDHEQKVSYSDRELFNYANQNGFLLDGKGKKLELGAMSDLTEHNGKPAKVRLDENGLTVFYKKESLLIPDIILDRKLSNTDKQLLLKGDIIVIPGNDKKRDIYLQVDKELNSVIVKSTKEISIPDVIGKTNEYPGYKLTDADKCNLANGHTLENKLLGTKNGYFIADVSLTVDKRGVSFTNIQSLTYDQARTLIQNEKNHTKEQVIEDKPEQAPERTTSVRDMEAEFKDAVNRNDFVKISHLKEEGYQPSANALIALEKDGNLSPNTRIAINKIFGLDTDKNNTLGDIKLAREVNPEQNKTGQEKLAGTAKLVDRMFGDL
jgi:hypothetical protein